ncbi:DUF2339 domain-containing protein [Marinimicrococcus flavescens]|uniref:DUF2339 domain-containing protein n=1 Tax=Marinimicrococcus flavescens TaxID=3031815 RepID=A0AAP3UXT3_9PROT|nr:DUF2339 domain-containing protein [Marinimicrococcus flavescens]
MLDWTLEGAIVLLGALLLLSPLLALTSLLRLRRMERRLVLLEAALRASAAPAQMPPEVEPAGESTAPAEPQPAPQPGPEPVPAAATEGLEERLTRNWFVWLGGVALGLGGLFVAGWAIESGLLGPSVRLGLGALLGLALVGAGERLRRRPAFSGQTDHVPAALAAGGLCALYGASLAAHLLYAYLPSGMALTLLALVAALALGLALRHGQALALLGLTGAMAAPLLVAASEPRAWALFSYLAGGALAAGLVVRLTGWRLLALLLAAFAVAWPVLWLATLPPAADAAPLSLYALLVAMAGLLGLPPIVLAPAARRTMRLLVVAMALLQVAFLVLGRHEALVLAPVMLLSLGLAAFAARRPDERWLAVAAVVANLLAVATWQLPLLDLPVSQLYDPAVALEPLLWLAPEARPVALAGAAVAFSWALGGFLLAARGVAPGFWGGLAVAVPLAVLALLHARLEGLAMSPGFATLGLGVAALALAAASLLRRRGGPEPAVAAFAIGVLGALALAFAMILREAWLVVALAALVPACGWVAGRTALPALARPALWIAGLLVAHVLWSLHAGDGQAMAGPWTILYANGLPLLAFLMARRLFAGTGGEALAAMLRGGAILFGLLLVAGEAAWVAQATGAHLQPLLELALRAMAWAAGALALLRWHQEVPHRRILLWGWALLLAGAAAQVLQSLLLDWNPVVTGLPVGSLPLLNLLLPAYALPALMALAVMTAALRAGWPGAGRAAGVASLVLALAWLGLEIRHAFEGADLSGPAGEAELLAHTAGWLAAAGLLLAVGIGRDLRPLRRAGLLVAGLAVAKAFLVDLAELDGLYRAASFLALGLCLVGLGWVHRRFVAAAG